MVAVEPAVPDHGSDLAAWAASGAMALTGRPDGSPLVAPGDPAGTVGRALDRIARATHHRTGTTPALPDARILGERAAIAGLHRRGPWSCGGAFRLIPTADGSWGLSLPRESDLELIPALIESDVIGDPWLAVAQWSGTVSSRAAVERGRLLGLPCSDPTSIDRSRPGVVRRQGGERGHRRERPRVVDFTSLWAGPLCAHLLDLCDAEVIKVESLHRPDGTRRGPRQFFDLLHGGHAMVAVDFHDPDDVGRLHRLVESADLVLEASRPRALARLGLDAEQFVARGVSWLSITARGRHEDAVGFGDDVATGAGFVVDDGGLLPCADALADPLTGVTAAAEAADLLISDRAALVDVSMHHVCAEISSIPTPPHEVVRRGEEWWLAWDGGERPVHSPAPRAARRRAGDLGADTDAVLGRLP